MSHSRMSPEFHARAEAFINSLSPEQLRKIAEPMTDAQREFFCLWVLEQGGELWPGDREWLEARQAAQRGAP